MQLYDKLGQVKLGDLTDTLEAYVEEERNGLFELTFDYPNNYPLSDKLEKECIVIANANDTLRNQKFRIYDTQKFIDGTITVFARHISFDLMYDIVNNVAFTNQSCEYALNQLFRQSQFSTHYRGYSDIINAQDYSMSMCNILEAIGGKEGSIIDTYGTGAEILRDNTDISVLNRRGHDNGVSIEYAKNLTGFELDEDTTDLITRIIPFAKYTDESSKEIIVKANAVDSPLIDNYSHPYIRYIDLSDKFENGEIPSQQKLIILAQNEYRDNKVDIPRQNYKIEFIPLSKCVGYEGIEDKISLCDIVTIKNSQYNINTQAKVIKYKFNVLTDRYESMELGEPKTSLGDIIGGGGGEGEQGPPGPQGPPGVDGSIGDFPNSLPSKPVMSFTSYGLGAISLTWTYEDKVYYAYEVYASKTANFTPNFNDLIHEGQTSSYLFQAKPGETWYFKTCAKNSHGNRTDFSDQITVTVNTADDFDEYFSSLAVSRLVADIFSVNYMEAGIIKGHWIDAKQLSVTDGNGKRTLDIDNFGRITLMPSVFKLLVNGKEEDVSTHSQLIALSDGINVKISETGGTNKIRNSKCLNNTDFMYIGGHTGSPDVSLKHGFPNIQFTVSPYGASGGFQTFSIPVVQGEKYSIGFDYVFERGMENYIEIHYYSSEHNGFGAYPDIKKEIPYDSPLQESGRFKYVTTVPQGAKFMKFYIYTTYNGTGGVGYAHAYIDNFRCFEGETLGAWQPHAEELYLTDVNFDKNGMSVINKDGYKALMNGEGIDFLAQNGNKRLALTSGAMSTYNKIDGNYLGGWGAVACGQIYGNAFMSSRHNAFVDFSHNVNHLYDTEIVQHGDSYFKINFFDYNYDGSSSAPFDEAKGVYVNKVPLTVNNNLYVSNNLHVTQDMQIWGDISSQGNIDLKRLTCRNGIDMKNMSIENIYATKFGYGSGCLVRGDGKKLELGGTSSGDSGGTKIGIADTHGNVSETIWISSSDFVWNKADWNWGNKNIYEANIYKSNFGITVVNNNAKNSKSYLSTFDAIDVVETLDRKSCKQLNVSNVIDKSEILLDENNADLEKIVVMLFDEVKKLKSEIELLKARN